MIINNKEWLDNLYCWLSRAYENKGNFKEFCVFMSDFKKHGITYDEMYAALRRSEKITEDIFELSMLSKDNNYYIYRVLKKHMIIFTRKLLGFPLLT